MPNAFTVENRQTEIITQIIVDFGCLTVAGAKVLGNCSSSSSGRSLLEVPTLSLEQNYDLAITDRSLNLTVLINKMVKTYGCPVVNAAYNLCVTLDPGNVVTKIIKSVGCATVLFTSALSKCPVSRTVDLKVETDVADFRSTDIIQTYGCPAFSFARKVCAIIDPKSQNAVVQILATVGCYGVQAALSVGQCSANTTSSTINALIKTYGCPPFQIAYNMCQQYNATSSG